VPTLLISLFFLPKLENKLSRRTLRYPANRTFSGRCSWNPHQCRIGSWFSAPAVLALTQRRVGFVAGTTGAAYVQGHLRQGQYVPVGSTDEGLQALRVGKIDVFVHDAVTAWRVGDNEANEMLTSSFSPLTTVHPSHRYAGTRAHRLANGSPYALPR